MGSVVERLLVTVAFYSSVKHPLSPESRWFLREPTHPRWFESSDTVSSLAIGTPRPVVEFLVRVTNEAARNPFPTMKESWRRNQGYMDSQGW